MAIREPRPESIELEDVRTYPPENRNRMTPDCDDGGPRQRAIEVHMFAHKGLEISMSSP